MLKDGGYVLDHQTGSHRIYKHPTRGTLSVPFHGSNNDVAPGTLKAILKIAGLK